MALCRVTMRQASSFIPSRLPVQSGRAQGDQLAALLDGGTSKWRTTPLDKGDRELQSYDPSTDSMKPTFDGQISIVKFVDHDIFVEEGRDAEANRAISTPGSFYSYGRGGSLTIVDPARGKVYFAYEG